MKRTMLALRLMDVAAWATLGAAVVAWRKTAPVTVAPQRVAADLRSLCWRDWRTLLVRTVREAQRDQLTMAAGGVTFSVLLSIFPTLAAFVSLYGLFADVSDVSRHLARLSRILPPGVVELIGDQMVRLATTRGSALGLALALSVVVAIWSANSGMGALFNGLNVAYGEVEARAWWKRILLSLAFTAGGLIVLILLAAVTAALPAWLTAHGLALGGLAWLAISWVVLLGVIVSALACLYRFAPSHSHPARRAYWPGAVAGAVLWLATSVAFSTYVGQFGHYDRTYGSLGAIIGFMVWIWCSALAVLAGAELNAQLAHAPANCLPASPAAPPGPRRSGG
jgi:membrane protein